MWIAFFISYKNLLPEGVCIQECEMLGKEVLRQEKALASGKEKCYNKAK